MRGGRDCCRTVYNSRRLKLRISSRVGVIETWGSSSELALGALGLKLLLSRIGDVGVLVRC